MHSDAIGWTATGAVRLLDQTRLPDATLDLEIDTIDAMIEAIQRLSVRGAPLIGVAAAMGLAAAVGREVGRGDPAADPEQLRSWFAAEASRLAAARPTAVNLRWAVERVAAVADGVFDASSDGMLGAALAAALRAEAQRIWDEDADMCRRIGDAGAARIPDGAGILTICNTGMLATGGIGTAFGVIRAAHERGKVREVIACETRPLRQGGRLTAWEMARTGIPGRVIVDGAAAAVMQSGRVHVVIAGADRIAANGDSANKIGTLSLARLARAYGLPFYIAAPSSTIDFGTASGADIPIEERAPEEIGVVDGVLGFNPAFDVTPAELIAGIVTEAGVMEAPYRDSLGTLRDR